MGEANRKLMFDRLLKSLYECWVASYGIFERGHHLKNIVYKDWMFEGKMHTSISFNRYIDTDEVDETILKKTDDVLKVFRKTLPKDIAASLIKCSKNEFTGELGGYTFNFFISAGTENGGLTDVRFCLHFITPDFAKDTTHGFLEKEGIKKGK